MLLQGGYSQVTVVRHMLQEAAIARPDGVADLKDAPSECSNLNGEGGREWAHWYRKHARLKVSGDLRVDLFSSLRYNQDDLFY